MYRVMCISLQNTDSRPTEYGSFEIELYDVEYWCKGI